MGKRNVGGVIIMHPGQNNYGTSLQGFATVSVIQRMGYSLRIIRYKKKRSLFDILQVLPGYIRSGLVTSIKFRLKNKLKYITNPDYATNVRIRTNVVNAFKNKYLEPLCDYYTGWDALSIGSKKYDIVFVGSDQVWGPLSLYAGFYNLRFVDSSVPRFSYASSFGKSFILKHQRKGVADFLTKMDMIGVREKRGAEIVKELTGKDAIVVADPTLLLSRNEWEEIIKDSDAHIPEPYILCYMLGPRTDNREMVNNIGKQLGIKVLSFNHMDRYEPADENFGDIKNYSCDCLDFVKLLSKAEYVVTDSFHCSVFSILFHKKFLTFYRLKPTDKSSSHSRIESLLGIFDLKERAIPLMNDSEIKTAMQRMLKEENWREVDNKLEVFRKESMDFLISALEINKHKEK